MLAEEVEPADHRMGREDQEEREEERGLAAVEGGAAVWAGLPTTAAAVGSALMEQPAPARVVVVVAGHSAMDQLVSQRWVAMAVLAEDHKTAAEGQ